jgi:tripartite ATP-independent transporter DctP family solute receptor
MKDKNGCPEQKGRNEKGGEFGSLQFYPTLFLTVRSFKRREKMKRHEISRAIVIIALISVLFFVFVNTGYAAKEPILMKIGNPGPGHPHQHMIAAGTLEFKDYVERLSGGAIQVEVYPGFQLGNMREMMEMAKLGTIQATTCYSAVATMFLPELEVIYIPFAFSSPEITWRVFDGWFGEKMEKHWIEKTGLLPLYQADNGGNRAFGMRKKQIYKPEDLKGLKIRIPESESLRIFVESFGGSAPTITFPELYSAVQTGVVDGFEVPVAVFMFAKLYEVIKYASITNHTWDMTFLLVNREWFARLPEKYRKIVIEAGRHAKIVNRGMSELLAAEIIDKLKKANVEVYTPDESTKEEFRKICQKPVESFVRKKIGDQWVDDFFKAVRESEAAAKEETGKSYRMFMK